MKCIFCQNSKISRRKVEKSNADVVIYKEDKADTTDATDVIDKIDEIDETDRIDRAVYDLNIYDKLKADAKYLAEEFFKLKEKGANNINLVTAAHFLPTVREAIDTAKKQGFDLPFVYNTSSYEKKEAIKSLDGLIDVYLPDFKYIRNETALKYSKAFDYPEVAKSAIEEMVRQQKKQIFYESNGQKLIKNGVIVRHLCLPGNKEESMECIKYLYDTYGDLITISIMNQYTPMTTECQYKELNRKLTTYEYNRIVDYAISLGIENAYIQEGKTCEKSFIPDFR
ncbi:MAG: radical SAM protein [Lachnospiraceae bacterium]|nr:radical SAM protein [Lachnospiraceae bacterium]